MSSISNEVVLLCLGYFLTYSFILNNGQNITEWRRLIGAIVTMCLGGIALISRSTVTANEGANIIGIMIFIISVIFGLIQLGKILQNILKKAKPTE